MFPRASYGLGAVAPDAVGKLVFTFDKIAALIKRQVFRVYFYENGRREESGGDIQFKRH